MARQKMARQQAVRKKPSKVAQRSASTLLRAAPAVVPRGRVNALASFGKTQDGLVGPAGRRQCVGQGAAVKLHP